MLRHLRGIKEKRLQVTWQSLSHHKTPEWYYRDKFGIFIHWGVYSVPAYGSEWYSRAMYDRNCREFEYHRKTYGTQDKFGYKDFIPMFRAEKFSAEEWMALFKKAGAKFVMPGCEDLPYVQTWAQVLKKRGILTLIWVFGAAIVAGLVMLIF